MTWLDTLAVYAAGQLKADERVLDALYARGVTDEQIALYQIGYLNGELPEASYASDFMLWSKNGSTMTNSLGGITGFQFRCVNRDDSRYMDFMVSEDELVIFGLHQALPHIWQTEEIFIVEGPFDLYPVQRVMPGVVATMTARITDHLVRVLRRLVRVVWLGYDADSAGQSATSRFVRKHGQDFDIRPIRYPRVPVLGTKKFTKDPGDLWEVWGDAQFQQFLKPLVRPSTMESFDAQAIRLR